MARVVKLIMVTSDNNNKFYTMTDLENGTFRAEWGRVEVTSTSKIYPISKWDSTYREKTRKGYKDVTEFSVVNKNSIKFEDINSKSIQLLVDKLTTYTKKSVAANYSVSADSVTELQISEAQDILDSIVHATTFLPLSEINNRLLSLYSVIPRRMNKVQNYLFSESILKRTNGKTDGITFSKEGLEQFNKFITSQQDILDSMKSQVRLVASSSNADNKGKTLLEAMGLVITDIDENDKTLILKELDESSSRFRKGFKVTNTKTQKRFDSYIKDSKSKNTKLLWHGSRNENWWSILDTGLLLRPTNVVITGKMFGYGIYFADKARKSIGYTSLDGSYWANGSSSEGYLALFNVHLGKTLETKTNAGFSNLTEALLRTRGDYHSVSAKAGNVLRNNEYIVYNQNQCTINYLVELK